MFHMFPQTGFSHGCSKRTIEIKHAIVHLERLGSRHIHIGSSETIRFAHVYRSHCIITKESVKADDSRAH